MFGKRAPVYAVAKVAPALPAWLAVDSAFNPVNVGIFLAALLFGMNA
ncbi:MAG: hypothetical protein QM647_07400 [Asticcacaulis sp.]